MSGMESKPASEGHLWLRIPPALRSFAWPASLLLGLCILTFFLTYAAPGDPARNILGPNAREDSVRELRAEMGLDRPLLSQFGSFLGRIVSARWGESWTSRQPVLREIGQHLTPTISLALVASIYSITTALLVNAVAFGWPGIGRVLVPILRLGISLPSFVVAIAAALATTRFQLWTSGTSMSGGNPSLGYLFPGMAVALYPACVMTTLLRDRIADILTAPFFRAARAVGYSSRELLWRVLLRNSWSTLLAAWVNQISLLVFSTIIVEHVFSFEGLGTLLARSIQTKDLPVLSGIILLNGLFFLSVQTVSSRLIRGPGSRLNRQGSVQTALQPT